MSERRAPFELSYLQLLDILEKYIEETPVEHFSLDQAHRLRTMALTIEKGYAEIKSKLKNRQAYVPDPDPGAPGG